MIDRTQLKTGEAPVHEVNGYVNSVLVLHVPSFWGKTNTYLSPWEIVNVVWYNEHQKDYLGWIELEHILPPKEIQ